MKLVIEKENDDRKIKKDNCPMSMNTIISRAPSGHERVCPKVHLSLTDQHLLMYPMSNIYWCTRCPTWFTF